MSAGPIDARRLHQHPSVDENPATPAPVGGRLLAAPAPDRRTHLATFGPLPASAGPTSLLEQVRLAGLTGRGGAGFPTAIKLQAVAAAPGTAVVVANGAEGEPASGKDRQLLLGSPHLVLDGLQVAARLTGADTAFVYVRPEAAAAVRRALAERGPAREDRVPVTVIEAADGFVAGQETAVVSRLNGGPARPQFARIRVTERGVQGRPTLVQNVETLGHLALIARYGSAWFRERGTPEAPGTFLATVHRAGAVSGAGAGAGPASGSVWEVPHGLPLGDLLTAATGEPVDALQAVPVDALQAVPVDALQAVPVDALQAVLVGGYHGRWLPLPAAVETPLSTTGLAAFGGTLGAGVVLPLAAADCGLEATARIVRWLAAESAQQCGPCRFGLPHLAGLLTALAAAGRKGSGSPVAGGAGVAAVAAIREAVGLVEGRGACHHPDGTARLVRSALAVFEPDVVMHGLGRCLVRPADIDGGS
jgi:NADH:ubiquinone oxidoreductase subunit F (NADH-binding)